MLQLLYVSTAAQGLAQNDLDDIVGGAVARNASLEVTGSLYYNGRNFMQLLEGPAPAVHDLMDSIRRDPRHSGVVAIKELAGSPSAFAAWNMRIVRCRPTPQECRADVANDLPAALDDELRNLMTNFATLT